MEQEKDIVERLRNYERDPMWAHHAEVLKAHCKEAADEIERLRAVIMDVEILPKKLRGKRGSFNLRL